MKLGYDLALEQVQKLDDTELNKLFNSSIY